MKQHYDNLAAAISHKNAILSEIQSGNGLYYTTSNRETKTATSFLMFNAHPVRGSYQETQVNWGAINTKIRETDQAINHHFALLQAELEKLKQDAAESVKIINQETSAVNQTAWSLGNQVSSWQAEYSKLQSINNDLSSKINYEQAKISNINYQISVSNGKIKALEEQIRLESESHNKNQTAIQTLKSEIATQTEATADKVSELDIGNHNLLQGLHPQQRAFMLMNLWSKKDDDSKKLVGELTKLEFDPYYQNKQGISLITKATVENDSGLFDLLLAKHPKLNLEIPTIQGKTLFQYVTAHHNDELAEKMLATNTNFSRTMLVSLKEGDTETLSKLFSKKPELCKKIFHGHTFLQLAVAENKPEVVKLVLATDKTTLQDMNFKGETSLKLALKLKHSEIIKTLAEYVDVKAELKKLIAEENGIDLVATLIETLPSIVGQLDQDTLYELINKAKTDLALFFIEHGAKMDGAISISMQHSNKGVFTKLYDLDKEGFLGTTLDKQLVATAARGFGAPYIAEALEQAIKVELAGENLE